MQWTDTGIVLSIKMHGERSQIMSALTLEHGRHVGVIRRGHAGAKSGKRAVQVGDLVELKWYARLESHIGTYTAAIARTYGGAFFDEPHKLQCLIAACGLMDQLLPERDDRYAICYEKFLALLEYWLKIESRALCYVLYNQWELWLLECIGYGLSLHECALTGQRNVPLSYVSPRTGCAVTEEAGRPYMDKLFKLPAYLSEETATSEPSLEEIKDGFALTGHFLEEHAAPHGRPQIQALRSQLISRIR